MTTPNEELQLRIRNLEAEVARLHTQIKKQRYGLNWLDVPEQFDTDSENKIPILEELPELAITNDDGKPTHILIEGDNYHALTCLNYTHKGKVDVIYIDPPYNTGNDGFTYKDKRILAQYPDGTPVPTNHPLRHSYWLSFMSKRLELAKNLLSDRGVIFISIDDNEQANLKLLCDKVFGEENLITSLPKKGIGGRQDSKHFAIIHEYVMCYAKKKSSYIAGRENKAEKKYKFTYKDGRKYNLQLLRKWGDNSRRENRPNLFYPLFFDVKSGGIYVEKHSSSDIEIFPMLSEKEDGCWRWGKKTMQENIVLGCIEVIKKNNEYIPYERLFEDKEIVTKPFTSWIDDIDNNTGATLVKSIMRNDIFAYPKPLDLICKLLQMSSIRQDFIILDFFGGSGTTLHATMQLNAEDGGKRQCILVQQKESEQHNICREITYERNRRVMQGYTDSKGNFVAGLGNSLRYYRTAFVGKNKSNAATDPDKVELSQKAGCLLALGENMLDEIVRTSHYQIFTDGRNLTAVYFTEDSALFDDFLKEIAERKAPKKAVYIFSWSNGEEFSSYFDASKEVTLKGIPQPILDIYRTLNQ